MNAYSLNVCVCNWEVFLFGGLFFSSHLLCASLCLNNDDDDDGSDNSSSSSDKRRYLSRGKMHQTLFLDWIWFLGVGFLITKIRQYSRSSNWVSHLLQASKQAINDTFENYLTQWPMRILGNMLYLSYSLSIEHIVLLFNPTLVGFAHFRIRNYF